MNRARILSILLAVLLAATGCGAKPAASAGKTALSSASPGKSAAVKTARPSAGASAEPSAAASPAETQTPSPAPSPTELPLGTIVDGWVAGIPSYVPKFTCGQIDRSQCGITIGSMNTLFTLCFRSVSKTDLQAYEAKLQAAKFTTASEEIDGAYTLTACLSGDLDDATLIVTLNEASGTVVYSLGVPV